MRILSLEPRTILSSYGHETVELKVSLDNDSEVTVSLPFGISAGKYEARTVPATEATEHIKRLKNDLLNTDWNQKTLDEFLVSKQIPGNSSLAVSVAFWKAILLESKPRYGRFPKLFMLLFEGGEHGNREITMQEFILIENTISQGREDFQKMKAYLEKHDVENLVGAEGGFSPRNFTNTSVLETMTAVFPKGEFAIDVAGSFKQGEVDFDILLSTHNIKSLEDPFSDEEWGRWHEIRKKHGERVLIVGDDLTTTNPERLKLAIEEQAITGIVIKPNQNGTITGTLETIRLAKESGIKIIVSHRGEETDDDWIADFALFVEADFVKFGGMDRGERIAKYNRLLQLGMN